MAPITRVLWLTAAVLALQMLSGAPVAAQEQVGNASDFLVFEQPSIAVDDSALGYEMTVALREPPAAGVRHRVFFEGRMRFDRCSLEFTADNYRTPQRIRVFDMPFATPANSNRNLPIRFSMFREGENGGRIGMFPVQRGRGAHGRCEITGNQHFRTFDRQGAFFSYQGVGDFTALSSDVMTIQTRHHSVLPGSSRMAAIGIRYGGTVFVLDATNEDPSQVIQQISERMDGVTISMSSCGTIWNINFCDGSRLKVDRFQAGGRDQRFFNAYLELAPAHRNQVRGLCGTFNDNAQDDLTGFDGRAFDANNVAGWGDSWRVRDQENIFKLGSRCQFQRAAAGRGREFVNTNVVECQIPSGSPFVSAPAAAERRCVPNGFSEMQKFRRFQDGGKQIVVVQQPPFRGNPSEADLRVALGGCTRKIRAIDGCQQFEDIQQRIAACEADIRARINPESVYRAHRMAYTDRCSRVIVSRCNEPDVVISQPALDAARRGCFGNFACDSQCATCTERGCLQCRDDQAFEVQGGRCVPRIVVGSYNSNAFLPPPPAPPALAPGVLQGPLVVPTNVEGVDQSGVPMFVPMQPQADAPSATAVAEPAEVATPASGCNEAPQSTAVADANASGGNYGGVAGVSSSNSTTSSGTGGVSSTGDNSYSYSNAGTPSGSASATSATASQTADGNPVTGQSTNGASRSNGGAGVAHVAAAVLAAVCSLAIM